MTKSHRDHEFGTLAERLEHFCALFETNPPELTYEDGEPVLTEGLTNWCHKQSVCMNWLVGGNPSEIVKRDVENRKERCEIVEIHGRLAPEIQTAFIAYLRAVTIHGISLEEAEPDFRQVVAEFHAGKEAEKKASKSA